MSKSSEAVKRWRENTKTRLVEAMGGKCVICEYTKCHDALEFHHINPAEKEFGLGAIRGSIVSWSKIVEEAKKCVLLCSRCHREIHAGITELPSIIPQFDSKYSKFTETDGKLKVEITKPIKEITHCPICNSFKSNNLETCSVKCAKIKARKVKERPTKEQLLEELKTTSYVQLGKKYGVSDNAIRKWLKVLG